MRRLVPVLIVFAALLATASDASANFVYWANADGTSIGRAKINGGSVNPAFIPGLSGVHGVAADSKYIYWTQGNGATSTIGRANLDGTAPNPSFIPNSPALNFTTGYPEAGVAVTASGVYWVNTATSRIGRADISGANPNGSIVNIGGDPICGIAADQNFVYWMDAGLGSAIGRANPDGTNPTMNFVPGVTGNCGLAVDSNFLYWGASNRAIGRAPLSGGPGSANNTFLTNAASAPNTACGVAVNTQYLFWGNANSAPGGAGFIGRSNLDGGSPNPSLIGSPTGICQLMVATPANKITVNSITKNTKKGSATISAKVPGPGQVTLDQNSTPPDVNAVASAVQTQGLTVNSAASFSLLVQPVGKTAKKLKKQMKKKGKGKVQQTVFIHFVPNGVAGVPNDQSVTVTLVKSKKKKKH